MKLNTLIRGLFLTAALSTASLFANSVSVLLVNGSEIQATTSGNGTFLTFCLEKSVSIYQYPSTYSYTIDPKVQLQNDPISAGTVYLYDAFLNGTLTGPNGSNTYVGANASERATDSALLQEAFWMLEGEMAVGSNYYLSIVTGMWGAGAYADADLSTTQIRVMNIWGADDQGRPTDVQSMLIRVPDAGVTVALLGLGLLSLAAFRRKL